MQKYTFGVKAKDKITGFSGILIGYCTYITGCDQYLVQPSDKKNPAKKPDACWFDEERLEILPGKTLSLKREPGRGCDVPAPVK